MCEAVLIRLAALVAEHLDLRLTALKIVRTEIGLREEAEVRRRQRRPGRRRRRSRRPTAGRRRRAR